MLESQNKINRYQIVSLLKGNDNIGVELGVAEGEYSLAIMKSKKFIKFYGIDSYADFQHNDSEYLKTKKKLSIFNNYLLIRNTFENSLNMFENNSLDFIYIDGFAHTGNNGGKTLFQWVDKLKIGGICAGDDYHDDWPLVKKTVQYFTKELNIKLNVTNSSADGKYSEYPSWFFIKENNLKKEFPDEFYLEGLKKHKEEIKKRKLLNRILSLNIKYYIYNSVKIIFPKKLFNFMLMIYKKIK